MRDRLLTPPFALITVAHLLQALGYASMLLLPLYLDVDESSRRAWSSPRLQNENPKRLQCYCGCMFVTFLDDAVSFSDVFCPPTYPRA